MSILDALRLQRSEQNSVRDLAMLPQAQIIKLAQMGQIPAEVVPVVISEKARMAQMQAQMQAAQQPQPPTVIEQAMAQNAQAETPMTGVASIPTQMFQPQSYQTGGIVAFQGGGLTDPFFERTEEVGEYSLPSAASPSLSGIDEYVRAAASRRESARQPTEAMLALERSLTEPGRYEGARKDALNMALLQAGLGIMAGTSPYALQNIGRGAAGAVESYGQQVGALRRQEREDLAKRAALDVAKQQQALADIASGESAYSASRKEALEEKKLTSAQEREEERTRRAESIADKRTEAMLAAMGGRAPTDRASFVNDAVAAKRAAGDTRPEAILRGEAQQEFNSQSARLGMQETALHNQILSDVDKTVAAAKQDPRQNRAAREFAKQGQGTEEDYWSGLRDRLVNTRYAELGRRTGAEAPAARTTMTPSTSAKPDISQVQGAPAGATIGNQDPTRGWEVVQNGKVIGYVGR